jgi:hypothetical protein
MYSIVFFFVINKKIDTMNNNAKIYKTILFLAGFIFIFLLIFLVFSSRGDNIEKIDRYKFMLIFFQETHDWSFFQYLTGAPRITSLSDLASKQLSFYEGLFSYAGDGNCYSVILHSYLLRIIFDHGIIGLVCVIFFTYEILKMSCIDKKIIWVTISILIFNGLSVSSFNSVFFPISMIFMMGAQYEYE